MSHWCGISECEELQKKDLAVNTLSLPLQSNKLILRGKFTAQQNRRNSQRLSGLSGCQYQRKPAADFCGNLSDRAG